MFHENLSKGFTNWILTSQFNEMITFLNGEVPFYFIDVIKFIIELFILNGRQFCEKLSCNCNSMECLYSYFWSNETEKFTEYTHDIIGLFRYKC